MDEEDLQRCGGEQMSDLVTLEAIAAEAHKADQMGRQTVEQLAKVGQMIVEYRAVNPTMADLSRVINATGYQQAHIYRLEKLAKHWPQIEQKHPESLRGALLLIDQSKPRPEPPKATPEPPKAVPAPDPEAEREARQDAAQARMDQAVKDANLSENMTKRLERVVKKIQHEYVTELEKRVEEEVRRRAAERFDHREKTLEERERLARAITDDERLIRTSPIWIFTEDEYRLILNCLHPDRAPEDKRDRYTKAFTAFRKLDPAFEAARRDAERRKAASERAKARYAAKKEAA